MESKFVYGLGFKKKIQDSVNRKDLQVLKMYDVDSSKLLDPFKSYSDYKACMRRNVTVN